MKAKNYTWLTSSRIKFRLGLSTDSVFYFEKDRKVSHWDERGSDSLRLFKASSHRPRENIRLSTFAVLFQTQRCCRHTASFLLHGFALIFIREDGLLMQFGCMVKNSSTFTFIYNSGFSLIQAYSARNYSIQNNFKLSCSWVLVKKRDYITECAVLY